MATTKCFQIKPNYCTSSKECIDLEKKKICTNVRYKNFNQTHFTAGDEQQFEQYKDETNGSLEAPNIDFTKNVFGASKFTFYNKYENIKPTTSMDTFRYIFHKFKKGIFIKIKNNQLSVFLPFSKKNYKNNWSHLIKVEPSFSNFIDFMKYIYKMENRPFNPSYINRFTDSWYSNNCLLRYEFPIHEGDTGNCLIYDMFETLCKERVIPDMEFFVNRRDFPLLTMDETEPYKHLLGNIPLDSHNYDKYTPILSMVEEKNYADISIPTTDDWDRISRLEGKFFYKTHDRNYTVFSVPWKERKPIAIFRGSSTGHGTTIDTNPRLKVAYLSTISAKDTDGLPLLNAGITGWNLRPRKTQRSKYLETIHIKNLPFGLVPFLTMEEQAKYKYIINIDGHVSAYRLSLELCNGFCVLLVDSDYSLWFKKYLKPYVHYVPVNRDLSNLLEQIRWCKKNDKKCEEIANNGRNFANTFLFKNGVLDYLQKLLYELKNFNGYYAYNCETPLSYQYKREINFLEKYKHEPQEQFKEIIFSNELSTILRYESLVKKINHPVRKEEITHEAFVGISSLNNSKNKNFPRVYSFSNNEIILEFIEGKTLGEYINSNEFKFSVYIEILLQLALCLQECQNQYEFIHYDLTPWNIILKENNSKEVCYAVNDEIYKLNPLFIPIMIDFSRSHILYGKHHYGRIKMFRFSSIQDILSIILTSLYPIASKMDDKNVIVLANYITGTKYRTKKFESIGDIKYFFCNSKKYETMIHSEKYELENYDPLHFASYLCEKFNRSIKIAKTKEKILKPLFVDETIFYDPEAILTLINKKWNDRDKIVVDTVKKIAKYIYRKNLQKIKNHPKKEIYTQII